MASGYPNPVKRRLVLSLAALALAAPASAPGATTVGSNLRARANYFTRCTDACTELQLQAGAARLAAPTEGVLTRWRVRALTFGGARLRVLHPAADGTLTVVATSDWQSLRRRHGCPTESRIFPASGTRPSPTGA